MNAFDTKTSTKVEEFINKIIEFDHDWNRNEYCIANYESILIIMASSLECTASYCIALHRISLHIKWFAIIRNCLANAHICCGSRAHFIIRMKIENSLCFRLRSHIVWAMIIGKRNNNKRTLNNLRCNGAKLDNECAMFACSAWPCNLCVLIWIPSFGQPVYGIISLRTTNDPVFTGMFGKSQYMKRERKRYAFC